MASSSNNYIPRPDGDFSAWLRQYVPTVSAFFVEHGLDEGMLLELQLAAGGWDAAFAQAVAAAAAAQAATAAKDGARARVERVVRPITAFVQSYPATTNADRAAMGISVRSDTARRAVVPSSRPVVIADGGQRLTHTLRLVDDASPTKRARPRGVERAEVFVALTPPATPAPAESHAYRYVQSVSDGSMTVSFDASQGGMQAHYLARWVTRRGAIGAWSEASSATIAA